MPHRIQPKVRLGTVRKLLDTHAALRDGGSPFFSPGACRWPPGGPRRLIGKGRRGRAIRSPSHRRSRSAFGRRHMPRCQKRTALCGTAAVRGSASRCALAVPKKKRTQRVGAHSHLARWHARTRVRTLMSARMSVPMSTPAPVSREGPRAGRAVF